MSRSASATVARPAASGSALPRMTTPWLLIAPSLILALFIISYPIFNIVYQSMHDVSRFGAIRGFNGLENFYNVFSDPVFLDATRRTLVRVAFDGPNGAREAERWDMGHRIRDVAVAAASILARERFIDASTSP